MGNFNLNDYVPVSERITKFYNDFNNGRINTEMLPLDADTVVFKASVYREKDDAEPSATGHASETKGDGYVNKTSHIENAETSAIGRALANLGYEIKAGIASREEMQKVERSQSRKATTVEKEPASEKEASANDQLIKAKIEIEMLGAGPVSRTKNMSDEKYLEVLRDQYKKVWSKQKATGKPSEGQMKFLADMCREKDKSEIDVCMNFSGERVEVFDRLSFDETCAAIKWIKEQ